MNKEILADNGYLLNINSFLFSIMVNHINEDTVEIKYDDFEEKRRQFWNCGKPCFFAFSREELSRVLDKAYQPYIYSTGEEKWVIDMNKIFDNFIDTLSKEELKMHYYKEAYLKIAFLYDLLDIDGRIFDPSNCAIASLLKCNWMFDTKEVDEDLDYLFDMAKSIKPDGNNTEWLRMMKKLSVGDSINNEIIYEKRSFY